MLPKKDKKHIPRRSSVYQKKRPAFDKGRALKSTLSLSTSKKANRSIAGVIGQGSLLGLCVIFIVSCMYTFLKVRAFDQSLGRTISQINERCKNYENKDSLTSILFLSLDSNSTLRDVQYEIYDKQQRVSIDFSDVVFSIDKAGTKGNLKKYVESNNIFLDEDTIFSNFSNLFLREFYLKVDHIIVGSEKYNVKDFINKQKQPIVTKLRELNKSSDFQIKTDICRQTWNTFIEDFNAENRTARVVQYMNNLRVYDLFYFNDLKKEQVRIQINNRTGVDQWGDFVSNLFSNYGLNVVKVDTGPTTVKSAIYVDDASLRRSSTLHQIEYLTENLVTNPSIDNKNSIFSDVYIDVGQDWLLK